MKFEINTTDGNARAATLTLNEHEVLTPIFMPVGTQASVKAITQEDLAEIGYKLILGNTYHLYLRPGSPLIDSFGGIHKFMSWPNAVLTDSGGYQAFSLSRRPRGAQPIGANTKLTDEGVLFKSHLDGSAHLFSPEKTIQIQREIGADIIMPIDDCAPYPADNNRLKESLVRTHNWLRECKMHWQREPGRQSLFGIAQGGVNPELRRDSAKAVRDLDLPGYAIGGLSVGEPLEHFVPALNAAIEHLPKDKPRYVMGVGSIPELINGVELGVDMFDCVLPTRNARNGQVFTSFGKLNLRAEKNALAQGPIDPKCSCKVCQKYSLGYLRHLHKQKEILGLVLSTYHNLHFMYNFMADMRAAIVAGSFQTYKAKWLSLFSSAQ